MRNRTTVEGHIRRTAAEIRRRVAETAASLALLALLALIPCLVGCSEGAEPPARTDPVALSVYAPWSMEKRLRRVFEKFELERPGVVFRLETGTPGKLVKQIEAGQRPDVYVSMGPMGVEVLRKMGIVRQGSDREILRQRMILVCLEAMKEKVTDLRDLAGPEIRRVGIGRPRLSAGTFTRNALRKLGILDSVEPKARTSPLRSLVNREVDAAIILGECCYDEDLLLGNVVPRRGLHVVGPLPESLCPAFPVVAIAIKGSAPAGTAQQFIDFLAGPEAQAILRRQGPGACPICDSEKCVLPSSRPADRP